MSGVLNLYHALGRPCFRTRQASDNIGFGLSDKPATWSYLPRDHAKNLRVLIKHLKSTGQKRGPSGYETGGSSIFE